MESLRKIIEAKNTNDEFFFLWQEFPALKSWHILSLDLEIYVFTLLNTIKEQSITNIFWIDHK